MFMKKILFLTLICLIGPITTQAKSLVLTLSDGTNVYYILNTGVNPLMKFNDGKVTVNTDTYTFSGIEKMRISKTDDPTGIEGITANDKKITLNGSTLYINTTGEIKIYSADANQIDIPTGVNNGMTAIDVSGLEKGVYIVKTEKASFKFLKK